MKPKMLVLAALAAVLLIAVGVWLFAPGKKDVVAVIVQSGPAQRLLAVNGRIRPTLQVDIRSVTGGDLVLLPFDVGDQVQKGQILARLDDAPETAAIAEGQAAVDTQQAVLAQARRDLARFAALGEFATKREVEQRRLAVVEGDRELTRRRAAVVQAQELRDRRVLRAPFTGVILERLVDPGQTIGVETIIYRLADLSKPEVAVEVDEIYAGEIRPGMAALIRLSAQAKPIRAYVSHVEPRVDPATGARDVRLVLGGQAMDAPSGLSVSVNLVIEQRDRAISVPRSAITQSRGATRVRVISADGVIADRTIEFIDWPAEQVIVTRGLKAGEHILADPDAAQAGETVRVAE